MKIFHQAAKIKKHSSKILRGWTKNEERFENIEENFEIFAKNLFGKLTFPPIFY